MQMFKKIRDRVSKKFGTEFNFVLINKYIGGNNYIGFHSDDERDLVDKSPIVGVSFGAQRELVLQNKQTGKTKSLLLGHGSVYAMIYPTNKYWKHSIPKNPKSKGIRISLTF